MALSVHDNMAAITILTHQ